MTFDSVDALDEALTTPSDSLVADLAEQTGDLVILGAGGKMGPTLCRLARRAFNAAGRATDRIYAVSRWSDAAAAKALSAAGVEIVPFDLLAEFSFDALPDADSVVFLVGAKFGASTSPYYAWEVNAALPDRVARRYVNSRIAVMSTGNVYPFVAPSTGGAIETDDPQPLGEYAMSCLGRERVFEFAAAERGTEVAVIRLNYAVDLRYGVLADIGVAVKAGDAVDVSMGCVNVVWQGYANEVILRSLGHASTDPFVVNLTGPETASIGRLAHMLAERLGTDAVTTGEPAPTSLLSNAAQCHDLFGYPQVPLATLVRWQASWLAGDMPLLGKPTKFAVTDGKF